MFRPTLADTFAARSPSCPAHTAAGNRRGAGMSDTSAYLRLTWGLLIVLGIILVFYALFKKRFSLLNSSEKSQHKGPGNQASDAEKINLPHRGQRPGIPSRHRHGQHFAHCQSSSGFR